MAGFLNVLLRNVLEGPSTDPFPLGETFTPKRFRGKVLLDPDLCMGCGICRHTCAAGAINIHVRPDQSGYDFTVWHNSCCLCASCRHYCPTGAITLTTDWHNAHTQEEKFTWLEQKFVPYIPCEVCGTPMRPTPLSIAKKIYINNSDVDLEHIIKLCPKCRQMEDARRHAEVPPTPEGAVEGEVAEKTDNAPAEAKAAPAPAVEAAAPEKQPQPAAAASEAKAAPAPKAEAAPEPKAEAVPKAEAAPAPKQAPEQAPEQAAPPVEAAPKAAEAPAPKAEAQPASAPAAPDKATPPKAAAPKPAVSKPAPIKGKPLPGKAKGKKTK